MPSKNRRHFAAVENGIVLDVRSSETQDLTAVVWVESPAAGNYTSFWNESLEYVTEKAAGIDKRLRAKGDGTARVVKVVETVNRQTVGQPLEGTSSVPDPAAEVMDAPNATELEATEERIASTPDPAAEVMPFDLGRESDPSWSDEPAAYVKGSSAVQNPAYTPTFSVGQKVTKGRQTVRVFIVEANGTSYGWDAKARQKVTLDASWRVAQ